MYIKRFYIVLQNNINDQQVTATIMPAEKLIKKFCKPCDFLKNGKNTKEAPIKENRKHNNVPIKGYK